MQKVLLTLILFFFVFSKNSYSQNLPVPFGIELGEPVKSNVKIIDDTSKDNQFVVVPPIKNSYFSTYKIIVVENLVVQVLAIGDPSDCSTVASSLSKKISSKYGKMRKGFGDFYDLEFDNYFIELKCDGWQNIVIQYEYKPLLDSSGL